MRTGAGCRVVFCCKILQIAYFLIAICCQKCYSIYIKICDNQMEAMEMGQSTISVRLDDSIKKQFDSLCAEFGMSASTAFNIYARTVVRQRKIPFEITAENDPFYSESNAKILKESIEQMEKHPERNVIKTLEELEELADG